MLVIVTRGAQSGNVDDFSNVNETRIKVLSSYSSRHVEVWCLVDKKEHISGQKHCFDVVNSTCPGRPVFNFLICGTIVVTVFTLCSVRGFLGWKGKFMRDHCKLSFLSPTAHFRVSSCLPLALLLFTISPNVELAHRLLFWLIDKLADHSLTS